MNFDGKLFGGGLFAGKLFGRTRRPILPSGPDEFPRPDPRRRYDLTDDELMDLGIALIMSGALDV